MGVEPKIGYTKMDGENNGTPYEQMDDLGGGVKTHIFGNTYIYLIHFLMGHNFSSSEDERMICFLSVA